MAHGIEKIRVHQALHGYADGHRLLACSTTLKPRDQKTMLVMSDVSGAGANLEASGYLTGYPLPDSGLYAIARTWAATEMARPGCVWTHTLLLDFADLAGLPAMNFLDRVFQHPTIDVQLGGYTSPLTIEAVELDQPVSDSNRKVLMRVLAAMYEYPKGKILASSGDDSSRIALLIWAQQWPRLRRNFRFCTLAFADRSTDGAPFDLQFFPARDRSVRSRFSDLVDADKFDSSKASWLEEAVEDISSGQNGKLRRFLKEVGGDIAGGREMFVPLCVLHRMIPGFDADSELIDNAISLIDSAFDATSASSLRSLLVTAVARHPESLSDRSADFLLTHLDLLSENVLTNRSRELGEALWLHKPDQLLRLAHSEGSQSDFAKSTIAGLDGGRLIDGVKQNTRLLKELFDTRPDLLLDPETWSVRGDWSHEVFSNNIGNAGDILNTVLIAGRSDLAPEAVKAFGSVAVLNAISELLTVRNDPSNDYSAWFDAAIRAPSCVAEFLGCRSSFDPSVLLAIAARTQPDTLPNEVGTDPWAIAIGRASGRLDERGQQYLAGYLLARAFGYRSNSQAALIAYGFDEIYFGAFNDRLADEAWDFLEKSLPRSWFFDWDRCQKLRNGVTDLFINRDLAPDSFALITRDDSLFTDLVRLTSYTSRGRRYLKKVCRLLIDAGGSRTRIAIIEDAI